MKRLATAMVLWVPLACGSSQPPPESNATAPATPQPSTPDALEREPLAPTLAPPGPPTPGPTGDAGPEPLAIPAPDAAPDATPPSEPGTPPPRDTPLTP